MLTARLTGAQEVPPADPDGSGKVKVHIDVDAGDPAVLAEIVANPDQYYVNLHNARFPGGAIRCQLED